MGNPRARAFMLKQLDAAEWERVRNAPRGVTDDVYAKGIGIRRLQLVVRPSFEASQVWEVRQRQTWQLNRPMFVENESFELKLTGYQPLDFDSAALADFFRRVTSLTLPIAPDLSGTGGCDGTSYQLAVFGDLHSRWRIEWWSHWPEQWRPLVELADEMIAAFSAARPFAS